MASKRRQILFLTPRVPFPPDKGDKIRTFHQMDHLAERHDVYCACFVDDKSDFQHVAMLRRWCKDVFAIPWKPHTAIRRATRAWLRGDSVVCAAYEDAAMRIAVDRWSERIDFDAAVAFSSCMAAYALRARAARRILDLCDADSQKWIEYGERSSRLTAGLYRSEGRRLRLFELTCLGLFDATLVVTQRERRLLDPDCLQPRIRVLPNGVALPDGHARPASSCSPTVCFVGAMHYRPNVEAVEEFIAVAWPAIRKSIPLARFLIVGRAPTRRVRRLGRVPGVEITGQVMDVRPFLESARVVVAPLGVARGLQNKILEAMAMQRPVVASSQAASNISAMPGEEIVIADRGMDVADRVIQLLREDATCDELGAAGQARVRADYAWPRVLREYERILLGDDCGVLPIEPSSLPDGLIAGNSSRFQSPVTALVSGTAGSLRLD